MTISQETAVRLSGRAAELERELVNFTRELIAIPSITGSEGNAANHIAATMRKFDFDRVFIDRIGNVVGQIGRVGPRILYDAHIDTVGAGDPSAWPCDPFAGKLENGIIYGRGACDDKGPFAAMLFGARILKDLGLVKGFTLYIVGSVNEENCEGQAVGSLIEDEGVKPDYVVVGEASELTLRRGHKGRALLSLTFPGTMVHASAPDRGDNPLYKAAPVVTAVAGLHERLGKGTGDPFLGRGSAAVTRLDSPAPSLNTVPGQAIIYVDRRLTAGESREQIIGELQSLPGAEGAKVEIVMVSDPSHTGYVRPTEEFFPPWALPEDHPLVQAGVRAYRQMLGSEPAVERWDFSTNGTYTMGMAGIPTIGFGPGEGKWAHTSQDQIPVKQLVKAAKFYAALPLTLIE